MKQEKINSTPLVFILMICVAIVFVALHSKEGKAEQPPINVVTDSMSSPPLFLFQSPEEGLWDALIYYDIHHPEIVYAQAIQESGLGKSKLYTRTNNLFGLYNSRRGEYFNFNHWSESVEAYKNYIQRRYQPPNDYYQFLHRIGYASDPEYIQKIKRIVKNEQRKGLRRDTITLQ